MKIEGYCGICACCFEPIENGEMVTLREGGIMSVPYMAVKMGRYGIGIELNTDYFRDGLGYLRQADTQLDAPTLFDFIGKEA